MKNSMKLDKKASFLIPLHNEAGIVANTLNSLFSIIDSGYEVLIGLDGCTDKTPDIVKRFGDARVFEYKQRHGKNFIITELTEHARANILFIHDADWLLKCSRETLDGIIEMLNQNPSIGGVILDVDNFYIKYSADNYKCSTAFRGEVLASRLLREYQFKHSTYKENGIYLTDNKKAYFPFMVNILNKKYMKPMLTTGDDIERWLILRRNNIKTVIRQQGTGIYFEVHDPKKSFKSLFLRHVRSHISNFGIHRHYDYKISFKKFYVPATFYVFRNICRHKNLYHIISVMLWYICSVSAFLIARLLSFCAIPTGILWKFRAERS